MDQFIRGSIAGAKAGGLKKQYEASKGVYEKASAFLRRKMDKTNLARGLQEIERARIARSRGL